MHRAADGKRSAALLHARSCRSERNGDRRQGREHGGVGDQLVVCASTPTATITGLLKPFLPSFQHAKTKMRIERVPTGGQALTDFSDALPASDNWSWCTL